MPVNSMKKLFIEQFKLHINYWIPKYQNKSPIRYKFNIVLIF